MFTYGSPQFLALEIAEQELRIAFGGRKFNRKNAWQALFMVRIARNRKG